MKLIFSIFLLYSSFHCLASSIGYFYALDEDVSKFEILGASHIRSIQTGDTAIQEFTYGSHRIYAVKMGSGPVQTCLAAQALLSRQSCDLAISVGPIGALNEQAKEGGWHLVNSVVFWQKGSQKNGQFQLHQNATSTIEPYFEQDQQPKELLELPSIGVASGEVFVACNSFRHDLASQTNCDGVDMNLFGLLAVLDSHKVPGIHLRIVSDKADDQASETFREFVSSYDGKGAELALQIISQLPEDKSSPDAHDQLRKLLRGSATQDSGEAGETP